MIPRGSPRIQISRNKMLYLVIPCVLLLVVFYVLGSTQGAGSSNAATPTPVINSTTQSVSENSSKNIYGGVIDTQPTATPEKAQEDPGFGFDTIMDIVVKLAIVIGLIFLTTKVLRFLNQNSRLGSGQQLINVIETRSLAQNQVLYLVEVGGKAVLVGATGSQLSTLTEITDSETVSAMRTKTETQVTPTDSFARYLQNFSQNFNGRGQAEPNNQTIGLLPLSRLQEATTFVRRITSEARRSAWEIGIQSSSALMSREDQSGTAR